MKYDEIIEIIEKADLFDLYALYRHIGRLVVNPARMEEVKNQIHVNQRIRYMHPAKNKMIDAIVNEVRRTKVEVSNVDDEDLVLVPFALINLKESDFNIAIQKRKIDKYDKFSFNIGERVGFLDKNNFEKHGIIEKLNNKTVSIVVNQQEKWRVAYSFIFKIVDDFGGVSGADIEPKTLTLNEVSVRDAPKS